MTEFELIAVVLSIAATLGYLNARFLKLPTTIGIMLMALVFSLALILIGEFVPGIETAARSIIGGIDFEEALLDVMLSYLLFAGALHVDLDDLRKQKFVIAAMATIGVLTSTFLIGGAVYLLLPLFGFEFRLIDCLLFGALISPTDPVAVLGILKTAKVPKTLETKITGESLFNDGVGVVVFLTLLKISTGEHELSFAFVAELFGIEVVGGIAFGAALGYLGYRLLRSIDNYQMEVLITLAMVTGGYALATALHISGPLAMVVAGLMIGNRGRTLAMSDTTRRHLDLFWELVDEILNALLFALIGLEVLIITFTGQTLLLGLLCIPLVLVARAIAVSIPITALRPFRDFTDGAIPMLTWGGLRGGISVALALALPDSESRSLFLKLTYVVVIFSISVQGLTVGRLYQRLSCRRSEPTHPETDAGPSDDSPH
jgi:CPA1 family monovalent cation:H+ antiporter